MENIEIPVSPQIVSGVVDGWGQSMRKQGRLTMAIVAPASLGTVLLGARMAIHDVTVGARMVAVGGTALTGSVIIAVDRFNKAQIMQTIADDIKVRQKGSTYYTNVVAILTDITKSDRDKQSEVLALRKR